MLLSKHPWQAVIRLFWLPIRAAVPRITRPGCSVPAAAAGELWTGGQICLRWAPASGLFHRIDLPLDPAPVWAEEPPEPQVVVKVTQTLQRPRGECGVRSCPSLPPSCCSSPAPPRAGSSVAHMLALWPVYRIHGLYAGLVAAVPDSGLARWACGSHAGLVAYMSGLWLAHWACGWHTRFVTHMPGLWLASQADGFHAGLVACIPGLWSSYWAHSLHTRLLAYTLG